MKLRVYIFNFGFFFWNSEFISGISDVCPPKFKAYYIANPLFSQNLQFRFLFFYFSFEFSNSDFLHIICIFLSIIFLVHYTLYSYQCTKSHITCSKLILLFYDPAEDFIHKIKQAQIGHQKRWLIWLAALQFLPGYYVFLQILSNGVHLGYLLLLYIIAWPMHPCDFWIRHSLLNQ